MKYFFLELGSFRTFNRLAAIVSMTALLSCRVNAEEQTVPQYGSELEVGITKIMGDEAIVDHRANSTPLTSGTIALGSRLQSF